MPNANRPSGLSPVSYLNGTPWSGQARQYYIDSANDSAFSIGDPVALSGSADSNGVPGIQLATAGTGNAVLGCIVSGPGIAYGGALVNPSNLDTTVIPATKTRGFYVLVCDDPNVIFEIQEGGAGAALTVANVGTNANLLSGTNNGYLSGWTFNNATLATTATLQLQLLGLQPRLDNAFGQYAKWLVRINNHAFKAGTAGV